MILKPESNNARNDFLESALRYGVVHLGFAAMILLQMMHIPLPGYGLVQPYFVLIGVYYWAIYRPTLISPVFLFFIGIMLDIILGLPLGFFTVSCLVLQRVTHDQRTYLTGQPFLVVWLVFTLAIALTCLLHWGLISIQYKHFVGISGYILNGAITIFLYPLFAIFLHMGHKILPDRK